MKNKIRCGQIVSPENAIISQAVHINIQQNRVTLSRQHILIKTHKAVTPADNRWQQLRKRLYKATHQGPVSSNTQINDISRVHKNFIKKYATTTHKTSNHSQIVGNHGEITTLFDTDDNSS